MRKLVETFHGEIYNPDILHICRTLEKYLLVLSNDVVEISRWRLLGSAVLIFTVVTFIISLFTQVFGSSEIWGYFTAISALFTAMMQDRIESKSKCISRLEDLLIKANYSISWRFNLDRDFPTLSIRPKLDR